MTCEADSLSLEAADASRRLPELFAVLAGTGAEVVHVLQEPSPGWTGATGMLSRELRKPWSLEKL